MAQATTTVASWGNSAAVRIPRPLLQQAGLSSGDSVTLALNDAGGIEIRRITQETEHRRARPQRHVHAEDVFAGYACNDDAPAPPWPDDDMLGAEYGAWSA